MIFILLILFTLACIGLKKSDSPEQCLSKEHTNAIKGIFIIIVFYSHILTYLNKSDVIFSPLLDIPANNFIRNIGQLMVVMFLFYSGYGIMESIIAKGKWYIKSIPTKRILSTLVNYDIAIVVFLFMNLLLNLHFPIRQYLLSLIAWDSVGQSNWYIFAILCCYFATYISFSIFNDKRNAFITTFLILVIYYIILHSIKDTWWYNTILAYPTGMIISLFKKNVFSLLEKHYPACIIVLFLLFVICYHFRSRTFIYLITAIIFSLLVLTFSYKFTINNRILIWCGKQLFQLYVYQRISMIALITLFPETVRLHPYVYVSSCLVITLLFAVLIKPLSFNLRQ